MCKFIGVTVCVGSEIIGYLWFGAHKLLSLRDAGQAIMFIDFRAGNKSAGKSNSFNLDFLIMESQRSDRQCSFIKTHVLTYLGSAAIVLSLST